MSAAMQALAVTVIGGVALAYLVWRAVQRLRPRAAGASRACAGCRGCDISGCAPRQGEAQAASLSFVPGAPDRRAHPRSP